MSHEERAREVIEKLFENIDSDIKLEFVLKEEHALSINVRAKDPQMLIGEKGQTLIDTERLIKIMVRKQTGEISFVNLDINGYKKKKAEYLRELAIEAADEVCSTGVEKKFPPMPAHERRIIHLTLSDREDVVTESVEEGTEKRVVVKQNR